MVWGCFTEYGIGNLCYIEGKLNGEGYRKILADDFIGTLNKFNLDINDVVFQQDNDPKHVANLTKKWFEDNNVTLLDWPPQSPDLNPIEHLWDEVDRRLRNLPGQIHSKKDLWEKIQQVWNDIEIDTCSKLIESMPNRLADVIKAKGGYTRW